MHRKAHRRSVADLRQMPAHRVSHDALVHMAGRQASRHFQVAAPQLDLRETAILGRFNNIDGLSGLQVHATDTQEAHDLQVQWQMPPSLTVAVVLEGRLHVRFDDEPMLLGGENGPMGQAWSLTRETCLQRHSEKGMRVRKVVISLPMDWVNNVLRDSRDWSLALSHFVRRHRAMTHWQPSKQAVALAEQILSPGATPMVRLAIESKAIEIVREALSRIAEPETAAIATSTGPIRDQNRAGRIRRYLLDNRQHAPSLQQMAGALGMSVGSMQDSFKQTYCTTIGEFHRELRLQDARLAIEKEGISIAEAAYRAGYANPASFSTAFKRLFGLSPSTVKA